MRVLIVYGTTEGHTRHLADFAAECLRHDGNQAHTVEAGHPGAEPEDFDAVIVAASLHVGRYQPSVVEYARAHHERLGRIPSAFISVSLSAAGENPDDWEGLDECVARFRNETLWTPAAVHHAAGAIRYSRYDFFKRLLLHRIAAKRGRPTVTSRDYDLTDYDALQSFVLEFVAEADPSRGSAEAAATPHIAPGVLA
jgi:menaquinone-dependent protoporphyrinogen oxidase